MALGKGTEDLDYMLGDAGVPVSLTDSTGVTHHGFATLDENDEEVAAAEGGEIAGKVLVATLRTGTIPVAAGLDLIADGVIYRVTQIRQQGDGAVMRAWLARKE